MRTNVLAYSNVRSPAMDRAKTSHLAAEWKISRKIRMLARIVPDDSAISEPVALASGQIRTDIIRASV